MGYYFTLDLSGYKGKENEIYDIIIRFNEQLHKETGLSLCEYLGPSKEEINNYYQEKGIVPLLEELIWSKLTVDQQANKIVSYIPTI